jgi:hypothetical protein
MYKILKENVESLTPCTPENGYEECDYCGRYDGKKDWSEWD